MGAFSLYTTFVTGLASQGTNGARPTLFALDGELYLYNGGKQNAWKWNNSTNTWDVNTLVSTFDVAPGDYQGACAFWFNSELYMILGSNTTVISGYKWSVANQRWEQNTGIIAGITLSSTYNHPTVFTIGVTMYLIFGDKNGLYNGFEWNGSQWVTNAGIIAGLADAGSYVRPMSFNYGADLFFVALGNFSYKWNALTPQWDTDAIGTGLPTASYPTFTSIEKDGVIHVIAGTSTGGFSGYRLVSTAKITSVTAEQGTNLKAKLTVNLSEPLEPGDTLEAYNAPDAAGLGNPLYLVELTQLDPTTWEYQTDISEGEYCYFRANQIWNSTQIDTADLSGSVYYILPAITPTVINITDINNYRTLNSPSHNWNHGSLFLNGFVYGSARNIPDYGDADIFKIQASDYSILSQETIFLNKTAQTGPLYHFDQIVFHKNYLWVHSGQYLIRINPGDLDYIVFSGLPQADNGEPLTADSANLFLFNSTLAAKIDSDLLLGTFASYGYDGSAPVAAPANTVLATCNLIQLHPTVIVKVHSSQTDSTYLYLNCSQTDTPYDEVLGLDTCHFQKIRKLDMVTVGDVTIPQSTDDIVQDGEYIFLGPEIGTIGTNPLQIGYTWGLFAVNKQTLEIKYLKGLWPHDQNTQRACYGLFYFNNKLVVQQKQKATIVINTSEVDQWGDNFALGGATDNIFTFQLNGVNFTDACNELIIDNVGNIHTNTWAAPTLVFKFPLSTITAAVKTPNIATSLIYSGSDTATIGGLIIDEGNSPVTAVGFNYGTAPDSLINNVPVTPLAYDFQTVLSSLAPDIYYIQAYGTNTEGTFYGNIVIFSTYNAVTLAHNSAAALLSWLNEANGHTIRCVQDAPGVADGTTGTATDQDGNTYNTIVINQKRWFIENLKTTHYRNGDPVPEVTDPGAWAILTTGGQCAYDNNQDNV